MLGKAVSISDDGRSLTLHCTAKASCFTFHIQMSLDVGVFMLFLAALYLFEGAVSHFVYNVTGVITAFLCTM